MKIQCSCGAKYEFEVSADMVRHPVSFVCPACGRDASEYVNNLVRQQLGQTSAPPVAVVVPSARPAVQVRVHTSSASSAEEASEGAAAPPPCPRHPSEVADDKCYVCSKPICPKCKALFGYVCSPLCKAKAEAHGIDLPRFEGQKTVREAKFWRKLGWIGGVVGSVLALVFGGWFWYAWFGSMPGTVFSVRFPEPSFSGRSVTAGPDQIVFLHGDTLARYSLKHKNEIWSRRLFDPKQFDTQAAQRIQKLQQAAARASQVDPDAVIKIPNAERLAARLQKAAAAELDLRVQGTNIWLAWPDKLVRYDWNSGKPIAEISRKTAIGSPIPVGDEWVLVQESSADQPTLTRVNLNTCESRTETLSGETSADNPETSTNSPPPPAGGGGSRTRGGAVAGLPVGTPGKDLGKPLDPARVAEQARHMSYPSRIALPVLLANSRNQERLLAEMKDSSRQKPVASGGDDSGFRDTVSLIPTKDGLVKFSVRLLEYRVVERNAMKAPPGKSVLDGNLTAAKSTELANEILNDMQRERGGATVREDQSRYQVSLTGSDGKSAWTGEVVGTPSLYCLRTVNVLAGHNSVMVFDKNFRPLWQSVLNYSLNGEPGVWGEEDGPYGKGPVVEHKEGLYIYDAAVLTAFNLARGDVLWRLPSVGTEGVFIDDQDNLYVNTTSADLDKVKFSRQIDISQRDRTVVLKIDARTGKVLWRSEPGAPLRYVSGKFVYAAQWYTPEEPDDTEGMPPMETGFETPPYLRIKRLDPNTGRELWEHFQQRAPLDLQFDRNTIRLVFKKEVQVLKFLAL